MEDEGDKFVLPDYISRISKNYEIYDIAGEGTFSSVYTAKCLKTGAMVAIKAITKTSAPNRILEELKILKSLEGQNNCIQLIDVIREKDQILAVFPYIKAIDFKDFIISCTMSDVKKYMYNLLLSVKHVHANDIIHRDIKPSNFMYSMDNETGYLIDFGLAQKEKYRAPEPPKPQAPVLFFNSIVTASKPPGYYEKDTRPVMKAPRAGTRGFRAPEVLFKYANQSKAIDIWSVGVIFLSILTSQYPFFLSTEDVDGLVEIAIIYGHTEMRKAAKHYGRIWKSNLATISEDGVPFDFLIRKLNAACEFDENTIDLLNEMLKLIDIERISAEDALQHPFFSEFH